MKLVIDIESNNLLREEIVDFTTSPFSMKSNARLWCIVAKDIETFEVYKFQGSVPHEGMKLTDTDTIRFFELIDQADEIITHNGISFDIPFLDMFFPGYFDYAISPDRLRGRKLIFTDTFLDSCVQHPDRGGHSLEEWGLRLNLEKTDLHGLAIELGIIEENAQKGAEFRQYFPEMVEYCVRDCEVTEKIYHHLAAERGDWDWTKPRWLEKAVAEIIQKQSLLGFYFDDKLADKCVAELDVWMAELAERVNPLLPEKQLTQAKVKEFTPPKIQFKKNSELSASLEKWVEKHNGKTWQEESGWKVDVLGEIRDLPLPLESLVKGEPSVISDSTHIKEHIVSLGWNPIEWTEKDLRVDSKKNTRTHEKYLAAIDNYVEDTLSSKFCKHRCEYLDVEPQDLKRFLLSKDTSKPVRVITTPDFTVGQTKDLCPNLIKMGESLSFIKDVVMFMTYRHRRNSILSMDEEKGFLQQYRKSDNRIPTPAMTNGASTGRMLHIGVANIARASSTYGKEMRSLFGCNRDTHYLIGYDFAGLEARVEGHAIFRYEGGEEMAQALVAEKPGDVHTLTAKKMEVSRDVAKTLKYSISYGAQPAKISRQMTWKLSRAKQVFEAFWAANTPLKQFKEAITKHWKSVGGGKWIPGIDNRKLFARSAHSVVNLYFQSTGAIAAKLAMVIWDRNIKKETIDAQQLIAYHDEAQIQTLKKNVEFWFFDTEEEASAFKVEGKILSNVGHTENIDVGDKPFFKAYTRAGELAVLAAREAGVKLKLRVPLDSDYSVGFNWYSTH